MLQRVPRIRAGDEGLQPLPFPERTLWLACLRRAVFDLEEKDEQVRASAQCWFADRSQCHIGSWGWLIEHLDLGPGDVKQIETFVFSLP